MNKSHGTTLSCITPLPLLLQIIYGIQFALTVFTLVACIVLLVSAITRSITKKTIATTLNKSLTVSVAYLIVFGLLDTKLATNDFYYNYYPIKYFILSIALLLITITIHKINKAQTKITKATMRVAIALMVFSIFLFSAKYFTGGKKVTSDHAKTVPNFSLGIIEKGCGGKVIWY